MAHTPFSLPTAQPLATLAPWTSALARPVPFMLATGGLALSFPLLSAFTEQGAALAFVLTSLAMLALVWRFVCQPEHGRRHLLGASLYATGMVGVGFAHTLFPHLAYTIATVSALGAAYAALRLVPHTPLAAPRRFWPAAVTLALALASVQPFSNGLRYGAYLAGQQEAHADARAALPAAFAAFHAHLGKPGVHGDTTFDNTLYEGPHLLMQDPLVALSTPPHFLGTAAILGWDNARRDWVYHAQGRGIALVHNFSQIDEAKAAIRSLYPAVGVGAFEGSEEDKTQVVLHQQVVAQAYHTGHPIIRLAVCKNNRRGDLESVMLSIQSRHNTLLELWAQDVPSWLQDACKGWTP